MTPDFSAYAARVSLIFDKPRTGSELQRIVETLMSRTAVECVEAGATLIGHIKCIAETKEGGHMTCSVTDMDGKARCRGDMGRKSEGVDIVINILLYGLDRSAVEEAFDHTLHHEMEEEGARIGVEDLDLHDHVHEHDHEPAEEHSDNHAHDDHDHDH